MRCASCATPSARCATRAGRWPTAAMILVAGMLLLLPGFFTDACGLLLLIPPVRRR